MRTILENIFNFALWMRKKPKQAKLTEQVDGRARNPYSSYFEKRLSSGKVCA